MVAPVSGPFTHLEVSDPFRVFVRYGYRQAKPYTLPLPVDTSDNWGKRKEYYLFGSGFEIDNPWVGNPIFEASNDGDLKLAGLSQSAYNRAFGKFRSEIGDSAGWGENFAQWRAASSMVNERLTQMVRFVSELRRGRLLKAAHVLRMEHKPFGASRRKKWQDNFLEFEYGWRPLMNDISSSIRILTDTDFGARKIFGTSRESASWADTSVVFGYVSGNGVQRRNRRKDGYVKVRISARVRITNPNLYLAGAMGVIDPALPWKLVPYSFVVDWFVNVEQVLTSLSGFLGLSLEDPYWSQYFYGVHSQHDVADYQDGQPTHEEIFVEGKSAHFYRHTGIPNPPLIIKPFKGFSVERGLQAIALLTGFFGRK